jgi:FKBP-type peptidyl-prolyl cis-trans isomerase 2
MLIHKGVKLISEEIGNGDVVERLKNYILAIRVTLNRGEIIRRPDLVLSSYYENRSLEDGYFVHSVRVDRENCINGIFYTLDGMRVGGYRKVIISPHLAFGEKGIPNLIPPNAKLIVEIKVLNKMNN